MAGVRVILLSARPTAIRELSQGLADRGYVVAGSSRSAKAAIKRAKEARADVVLLDAALKGSMNVPATVEAIRSECNLPVVLFARLADKNDLVRVDEAGLHEHLIEPFEGKRLRAVIQKALRKHPTSRPPPEDELRFRALIENSADMIEILDSNGIIRYASPSHRNVLGYEPEELLGRNAFGFVNPADVDKVRQTFAQAVGDPGKSHAVTFRFRHEDGTWRFLECIGQSRLDDPAIAGVVINSRDVTESIQAEEALRESEARFRELAEMLPETVFEMDSRGNITFTNRAGLATFGYTERDLEAGLNLTRLVVPEEVEDAKGAVDRVLAGEEIGGYEATAKRRDGGTLPVMVSSSPIVHGGRTTGVRGIAVDISERKRAEKALESEHARLFQVLDMLPVLIHLQAPDYSIPFANRVFQRLFGKPNGRRCHELIHGRREPCEDCPAARVFATGASRVWERTTDAGLHHMVHADLLRTADGTEMVLKCAIDVTEQKRTESELADAKQVAEAANQAKSEFLANMSHEIRTPMTAILGYSDLLVSPNASLEERNNYLQTIRRNGRILLELIDDILDLSKIEAGRMLIEVVECHPHDLVEEVMAALRLRAIDRDLALNAHYEFPLPETIHTDRIRLRQILLNLVGNAIKFTETGRVDLTVRYLAGDGHPPRLEFAVADSGVGIAADEIDGLFKPFTQADMSTARRFGGTGLGLTISRRLAEMLGGAIEVQSELGVGSTFTLSIDPGRLGNVRMIEKLPSERAPQRYAVASPERKLAGRSVGRGRRTRYPTLAPGPPAGGGRGGRPGVQRARGLPEGDEIGRQADSLRLDSNGRANAGLGRLRSHPPIAPSRLGRADHRLDRARDEGR